MAKNQRTPGADVVDIGVAIGINEPGAFAAGHEYGRAADAAKSAHRRIDASGNQRLTAREEFFRFLDVHWTISYTRLVPGTKRRRQTFISASWNVPLRFFNRRAFRSR